MTLQGKTILFFAGPLYEDLELWYPKIRLEEEGARTRVTLRLLVATAAQKQHMVEFGAVEGGEQTLARLADHLASR